MDLGSLKYTPELPDRPHEDLLEAPNPEPRGGGFFEGMSTKNRILLAAAAVAVVAFAYARYIAAPAGPAAGAVVSIPNGEGLNGAVAELVAAGAVKSPFALKALVVLLDGSKGVQAGDYYFTGPENAIEIAWRLTHGAFWLQNVRVTIPEGTSVKEIADLLSEDSRLAHFDKTEFIKIASPYEGYLFPDTYLLLPNVTAKDIVDDMLATYKRRIQTVEPDIAAFERPITDVIKMASIVEEEARTTETREIIAGILWKRLDKGMPLQVDAAFAFVNGKKDSRDLSTADLSIDSPYNTYIHKGLPPSPISNPGLDSIRAAVHPIATPYYYYLSDKNGDMHYAVTLDEHNANKAKYLNY